LAASGQGAEDRLEGICAFEPCCVDGGAHIRFGLCGSRGAIAVGDLSLDHAGPQLWLRAVLGGLDLAGIVAKRQQLVPRPPDLGLQIARQSALRRRAQDTGKLPFERALFAGDGRGFEIGDVRGEIEGPAEPQLEP
jgi:hypothetical protein